MRVTELFSNSRETKLTKSNISTNITAFLVAYNSVTFSVTG